MIWLLVTGLIRLAANWVRLPITRRRYALFASKLLCTAVTIPLVGTQGAHSDTKECLLFAWHLKMMAIRYENGVRVEY